MISLLTKKNEFDPCSLLSERLGKTRLPVSRPLLIVFVVLLCGTIRLQAQFPASDEGAEQPDTSSRDRQFHPKPPKLSGYIQTHYRYAFKTGSDSLVDHDDFRVQRVRLGIQGKILSWVDYDIEIDPRAPEMTGILRDAFITLKVIPRHKLRIGQQKMQFGYENLESSTRLFAVNRTEVSDNLSRGLNLRDVGIGLIGNLKLKGGFRLEEAITVSNGAGMNVQADDTPAKNVWGRIGIRYKNKKAGDLTGRLGLSGGIGDLIERGDSLLTTTDDFRLKFRRAGTDLEIDQDWFFFSAEFVMGWDENVTTGETDEPNGYYLNWVGKTPWNVGPVIRYDVLGDEFVRWTLGAFYERSDKQLRVLLNYELRLVKDDLRGDDKLYVWIQVKF